MARMDQALAAEFAGAALLTAGLVVVAAIAPALAPGQPASQFLALSVATCLLLVGLMRAMESFGGGFLNPIVALAVEVREQPRYEWVPAAALFLLVQFAGAVCGAWLADAALVFFGATEMPGQVYASGYLAEAVAGGSVAIVAYLAPASKRAVLVGIFSAVLFWFTDSAAFGNPAVTIARAVGSGAFGLDGASASWRALAQCVGALLPIALIALVHRNRNSERAGET